MPMNFSQCNRTFRIIILNTKPIAIHFNHLNTPSDWIKSADFVDVKL